jgi:hypothetical protein
MQSFELALRDGVANTNLQIYKNDQHMEQLLLGTIHLRRRHFLGESGQELAKFASDSSKKLPTGGEL